MLIVLRTPTVTPTNVGRARRLLIIKENTIETGVYGGIEDADNDDWIAPGRYWAERHSDEFVILDEQRRMKFAARAEDLARDIGVGIAVPAGLAPWRGWHDGEGDHTEVVVLETGSVARWEAMRYAAGIRPIQPQVVSSVREIEEGEDIG